MRHFCVLVRPAWAAWADIEQDCDGARARTRVDGVRCEAALDALAGAVERREVHERMMNALIQADLGRYDRHPPGVRQLVAEGLGGEGGGGREQAAEERDVNGILDTPCRRGRGP